MKYRMLSLVGLLMVPLHAATASWYGEESLGPMANGRPFDPSALTCASWFYPFGTRLQVIHGTNSVVVTVTDRGPAKRLVRKGRVIDLSRAAFARLAPLSKGVIPVTIKRLAPHLPTHRRLGARVTGQYASSPTLRIRLVGAHGVHRGDTQRRVGMFLA